MSDLAPAPASRLHWRIYPLRVLGLGLGGLSVASVLWLREAPLTQWLAMLVICGLWPQMALLSSLRSSDVKRAEMRNLMIDTALAGLCVPLLAFNPLACAVLVTVCLADKLNVGLPRMVWQSLPSLAAGLALGTWWWRPVPMWETPLAVVLCTLPLFIVHTLAVSLSNHRQLRVVSRQNRQLEALNRVDALTLLASRTHWMAQAEAVRQAGAPACLLVMDVDQFKAINDRHGHVVGDQVLHAAAQAVRRSLRSEDEAGRYGGDEFTVLCRAANTEEGLFIAERIRAQIEAVRLRDVPELRITTSIGGACLRPEHASVAQWLADADAALYAAKQAGRNRCAVRPS